MLQSASSSITPEQPHGSELLAESTVCPLAVTSELHRSCALSLPRGLISRAPGRSLHPSVAHVFIAIYRFFWALLARFEAPTQNPSSTIDVCICFSNLRLLLKSSNERELPTNNRHYGRPTSDPSIRQTDKQTNKQTSKANQMYYTQSYARRMEILRARVRINDVEPQTTRPRVGGS